MTTPRVRHLIALLRYWVPILLVLYYVLPLLWHIITHPRYP